MSESPPGPGWWLGTDGKWYPPAMPADPAGSSGGTPAPVDPPIDSPVAGRPNHTVLAMLLGGVVVVLVAGVLVAALLVTHRSATPSTATPLPSAPLPSAPPTTSSAAQAADEVRGCMKVHHMAYASTVTQGYTASTPPFLQSNRLTGGNTDPLYAGIAPTVTAFESCVWPPSNGADQTGYAQILLTRTPGANNWPGEIAPFTWGDVVDATCTTITAQYSGGHTGTSFSNTATVSAGGVIETQPGSSGAWATPPGEVTGQPLVLSTWAQALGYFIQPGEMAILHADDESVTAAQCGP